MKEYTIDCAKFKTIAEAYEYIKKVLGLPQYVSHNLDALWDAILDLDDVYIIVKNASVIGQYLGEYGLAIIKVFEDLQDEELDWVDSEILW